ncbi:LCP family protein [Phytoactinopolyspora halophila]|nr:LCP family protein [Phytoactinopolyspora halophila]
MRGHRKTGKIALLVWAGLVFVGLLVTWRISMNDLARLAVHPWLLTSFQILAFGFALAWVAILIDAWRLGNPPGLNRKHRLIMVGATLGLAIIVTTPFVVAARYAEAAHDLVVRMFPSGDVAAASDGRLNMLLLGMDSGDNRYGGRPDSIHVVSVDVLTGEPALISLPRNLEKARFASGTPAAEEFPRGFSGEGDRSDYLLNATWTYGTENPELFDGSSPGATAVKQAVQGSLGIDIHYYAAIDLQGFRDLVDALGGLTIDVHEELPIGEQGRVLEPGVQTLDGYHALWYARSRESTSDYDRMARQMCVLGAFLDQADPRTVLTNFVELADASAEMVTTDIPREDLSNLVDLALEAKDHDVASLQFVPPLIVPADPDFDLIAEETSELLHGNRDVAGGEPPDGPESSEAAETSGDTDADGEGDGEESPAEGAADESDDGGENHDPGQAMENGEPVGISSACSFG